MLDNTNNGGANVDGSGIVIRLKEGGQIAGQPTIGSKIFHLKGIDNDGDPLVFGIVSNPDGVIKVQNEPGGTNEASVILAKELDAEEKAQYNVVLSLTDGRLGLGNFTANPSSSEKREDGGGPMPTPPKLLQSVGERRI